MTRHKSKLDKKLRGTQVGIVNLTSDLNAMPPADNEIKGRLALVTGASGGSGLLPPPPPNAPQLSVSLLQC